MRGERQFGNSFSQVLLFVERRGGGVFDVNLLSLSSYFDAHGNYHAKEDTDSFQDNWLQDVDWNKVGGGEERERIKGKRGSQR